MLLKQVSKKNSKESFFELSLSKENFLEEMNS